MQDDATDPHIWLEDWHGDKAMDWVETQNGRTLDRLTLDPRYGEFQREALKIATAKDRIPMPALLDGRVFNFWRDADHPQGVWRWTSPAGYAATQPAWTDILDLDALSKAEGRKWVWKGASCLEPEQSLCLVRLSDGGEDAVVLREFDLREGRFVDGGFSFATSKQNEAWVDRDTVLLARDWGNGTMTASGYPFVVRSVRRGRPLDEATEVFRGTPQDIGAWPVVLSDAQGNRVTLITRAITFFESETYLVTPGGAKRLPFPAKVEVNGMVAGQLILRTSQDWSSGGVTVPAGALAAVSLADIRRGGELTPAIILQPGPRQAIEQVAISRSRVAVVLNDNVRGRILVIDPAGWRSTRLALPDNAAISIVASSEQGDQVYASVASFLDPTTLWSFDAASPAQAPRKIKALPARFDASGLVAEQFSAISTDGTAIPYFIVHRRDMPLDGTTPTIMTAYGGFEVSMTPFYSGVTGKLWLERGGAFAVANIRGGGEFGPAWHEAGRKTKRQIVYDDFAGVAKDIFARKLSSPARFGIYGGSNGGLLMGVEFNQHPDLWSAVTIQVPLLDMLRYEQIAAGASWVDEYGTVSNPEEKAFLARISPYANIRKGVAYPEPYIWTTTKDDRVGPQHARKFAARLKEFGLPHLFYEDTDGGHSGDADIEQGARLQAMQMIYFTQKLMAPPEDY